MVTNFLPNKFTAIAKTFLGLEPALAAELKELNYANIEIYNRAVSFETDLGGLYTANFALRTALHIIVPLTKGELKTAKDLYDLAYSVEWENIFKTTDSFAVASISKSKFFQHSKYPALLVKDAIADRFREKKGSRPNVHKGSPDVIITVHVFGTTAEIFLDSSGESLHKRGYRLEKVSAPLNEALAAGLIILSEWDKKTLFIDPMCGSGTIPIEAALYARNIPPNLSRKRFAYKNWKNFDLQLLTKIKNGLKRQAVSSNSEILASDISSEAIEIARNNAKRAGVEDAINFTDISFFDFIPPAENKFVVFNPPYDERIKIDDSTEFYREIGNKLKKDFQNSVVWIFSGNKKAIKQIGLSASKKIVLNNGGIESFYRKYEIYEGSKKARHQNGKDEEE